MARFFSEHWLRSSMLLRTLPESRHAGPAALLFVAFLCLSCGPAGGPQEPNVLIQAKRLVTGEVLEGADLLFLDESGAVASENFVVGPSGLVEVVLSPGEYRAHLRAWRHDISPGVVGKASSFQAPSSGTESVVIHSALRAGLGSTGWLDVLVEDDSGAPVGGVLVVAYSESQCNASTGRSWGYADLDGRARITNLAAGEYTLKAYGRHRGPLFVGSATVAVAGGNEVPARVGVRQGELARVRGQLTGEPLAGTVVMSLHEPITGAMIPGTRQLVVDREFEWIEVPSGRFLARVEVDGELVTLSPDNLKQSSAETIRAASSCTPNEVRVEGVPVHTDEQDLVEIAVPMVAAIPLVSPTGAEQVQEPPQMQWAQVPNRDFYVVEVRDSIGQTVYGGFAMDGTPRMKIPSSVTSLAYGSLDFANVDPSYIPNENLLSGNQYIWRVFGCSTDSSQVQGYRAVSVSSEGIGTFVYAPPAQE